MLKPLPSPEDYLPTSKQPFPKKDYIEKCNEDTKFKDHGIVAVSSLRFNSFKVLSFFAVLILLGAVAGFLYFSYNGNYQTLTTQLCGNVSVTCEKTTCPQPTLCPVQNCPACNCPTLSCPDVKVNCNSTG
jgi:hypothetical protein